MASTGKPVPAISTVGRVNLTFKGSYTRVASDKESGAQEQETIRDHFINA